MKNNSSSLKSILARTILSSLTVRVTQAVLALSISVILARSIGVEGLGIYAAMLAVMQLMIIPIQSGVGSVLQRNIARFRVLQNEAAIRSIVQWSAMVAAAYITIVITAAIALHYFSVLILTKPEIYVLVSASLLCAGRIATSIFTGYRKVIFSQVYDLYRNLLVLAFALFAFWMGYQLDPVQMLALFSIAAFITTSYHLCRVKSVYSPVGFFVRSGFRHSEWLKAALVFMFANGVFRISDQSGVILVRWLSSDYEAGLYQAAYQLSALLLFGLTAVTLSVMPYLTEFHESGNTASLQNIAKKSSQASFIFALAGFFVIAFFGDGVISLLFGSDFVEAWPILIVVSGGYLINSSTGASGALLSATGNEVKLLQVALISFLIVTGLSLILIPIYGGIGAAFSISTSLFVSNIVQWFFVRKYVGVDPFFIQAKIFTVQNETA